MQRKNNMTGITLFPFLLKIAAYRLAARAHHAHLSGTGQKLKKMLRRKKDLEYNEMIFS